MTIMQKQPSPKSFYVWIMLGLVVWGGLLAVGSFLGPEYWAPAEVAETTTESNGEPVKTLARPFDVRKPLIVLGCVGLFLGGWGLALRSRQKRLAKNARDAAEQALAEQSAAAQAKH